MAENKRKRSKWALRLFSHARTRRLLNRYLSRRNAESEKLTTQQTNQFENYYELSITNSGGEIQPILDPKTI